MSVELWNNLHDGDIVGVSGDVVGDIRLTIEMEYLRQRFGGEGKCFILTLIGCDLMEYRWEMKPDEVLDLRDELGEGIISASEDADRIRVFCTNGWLWVRYADFSLQLDTGEGIAVADLQAAGKEYWDEFGKRPVRRVTSK